MLKSIDDSAQDYRDSLEESRSELTKTARAELQAFADAITAASRAYDKLDTRATLYLAIAAQARGLKLDHEYLVDLAAVATDAVARPAVKRGPKQNEALSDFVHALAVVCEEFAGWKPTVTYDQHYSAAPYGGRFFEAVKACVEALGVTMTNQALGEAIRRTLRAKGRLSA
jgi:hypothetical protein